MSLSTFPCLPQWAQCTYDIDIIDITTMMRRRKKRIEEYDHHHVTPISGMRSYLLKRYVPGFWINFEFVIALINLITLIYWWEIWFNNFHKFSSIVSIQSRAFKGNSRLPQRRCWLVTIVDTLQGKSDMMWSGGGLRHGDDPKWVKVIFPFCFFGNARNVEIVEPLTKEPLKS